MWLTQMRTHQTGILNWIQYEKHLRENKAITNITVNGGAHITHNIQLEFCVECGISSTNTHTKFIAVAIKRRPYQIALPNNCQPVKFHAKQFEKLKTQFKQCF